MHSVTVHHCCIFVKLHCRCVNETESVCAAIMWWWTQFISWKRNFCLMTPWKVHQCIHYSNSVGVFLSNTRSDSLIVNIPQMYHRCLPAEFWKELLVQFSDGEQLHHFLPEHQSVYPSDCFLASPAEWTTTNMWSIPVIQHWTSQ